MVCSRSHCVHCIALRCYDCMSKCSFCWMISAFKLRRKSVKPPVSSSSMGTNCSTCLSAPGGGVSPASSASLWGPTQPRTSASTGRIGRAASGQKPTHTNRPPTRPEGRGHLKVSEQKQACRQCTAAAVTLVRAETTGSSRASPELRLCREDATQASSSRWYCGSPSCSDVQPGSEGSAENVRIKSSAWSSLHAKLLPNTRHRRLSAPWAAQSRATSDKTEASLGAWQAPQRGSDVQSSAELSAEPLKASFRRFSSSPSQKGEFVTAASAGPLRTYHVSTWHRVRGPVSSQSVPAASLQCLWAQAPWQPFSMRWLQLSERNSRRSLKEPVCFFWPRGRPAETLQQAGITVLRETHRHRGM